MMAEVPTLETDRLRLRGWRPDDLDPFAAMMADAECARFITVDGRPQDRAASWRIMALMAGHWSLRGFGMFVVERRADGVFVGRVGPWMPEGWPGMEIGWGIARPHWGQGYASEAARAAGLWAIAQFKPQKLISLIHVDNVRSQGVAMRLALKPTTPTLHAGQPHTIWAAPADAWGGVAKPS